MFSTNMEGEKFCLRWNELDSNLSSAVRDLRDSRELLDLTLACGDSDEDQVQVHRRGSGVPRGPRVRRRGVLQNLRGNEKTRLSLEPSGDAQNSTALQEPYGQAQRRSFITQAITTEMKNCLVRCLGGRCS